MQYQFPCLLNYHAAAKRMRSGEVHFYDVAGSFKLVNTLTIKDPDKGLINSFDFSPNAYYLYYISNVIEQSGIKVEVNRANLIDGSIERISASTSANPESQIRRFMNGNMYLSGYSGNDLTVYSNPDGAYTTSLYTAFSAGSAYTLQSTLTTKTPVKIKLTTEPLYADISRRNLGKKVYEITDHLGNVRTVVSDRKNAEIDASNNPENFTPDLISGTNYFSASGGMQIPGMKYGDGDYRYGYNGKEKDDEVKEVSGSQYDYGFRIYDPRLGKFLSVDPLSPKYPELTPYQYASNTPIQAIDLDGLEAFFVHGTHGSTDSWNNSKTLISNTMALFGNKTHVNFSWNGYNIHERRAEAAKKLVQTIKQKMRDGQPITIMTHSHGGNVATLAVQIMLKDEAFSGKEFNLITLNKPTRDDYIFTTEEANRINHYNIFNPKDGVVPNAGYNQTKSKFGKEDGGKFFGIPGGEWGDANLIDPMADYNIGFEEVYKYKFKSNNSISGWLTGHQGWRSGNVEQWFPKLVQAGFELPKQKVIMGSEGQ